MGRAINKLNDENILKEFHTLNEISDKIFYAFFNYLWERDTKFSYKILNIGWRCNKIREVRVLEIFAIFVF